MVCSAIKPLYASYSWLAQATGEEGSESYQNYENYDDPTKYNIKQSEYVYYNYVKFDNNVAVGDDYGQW